MGILWAHTGAIGCIVLRWQYFPPLQLQDRLLTGAPDVLCLQELIRRQDALDIVEAVKSQYPYHASLDNLTGPVSPQPACSIDEARMLGVCFANCAADVNDSTTNCVFSKCNHRVLPNLSHVCYVCVLSELGTSAEETITQCASRIPASEYTNPFGVLLLSSYRLSDIKTLDYASDSTLRRGYVSAQVN